MKKGDRVKIDYIGSLDDGTVFDTSERHGKPLEFEVGGGKLLKKFEDSVVGMKIGQEKNIRIQPSEGYGFPNQELIRKFPRSNLPKDHEPKPGMVLAITMPNGDQIPAQIINVTTNEITVDMNHPLAGKVLNFKVKIVDIMA